MKKLDKIPKKQVFQAPEGYFEKLPLLIQKRVEEKQSPLIFGRLVGLKQLALWIVPLLIIGAWIYISQSQTEPSAEQLLSTIDTEQLIGYLQESEITTDEILESFTGEDIQIFENEFYESDVNPNDEIIYEYEIESI